MRRIALALLLAAVAPASAADRTARAPEAVFSDFRYEGRDPSYGGRPAAPGEYLNPVIAGTYPDPSIVRVGRDYYLATSSFIASPGIPIFHSRDLVRWRQIGAAVTRRGQMKLDGMATWAGQYAPDIKYRDGTFYLLGTCYKCGGNFLMTARDPAGPWSDPTWLPFEGIDPSIFFDDDGRAYVLNNGPPAGGSRYDGHRAIWLQEIDLAARRMTGPRTMIVDGGAKPLADRPFWVEGPHLIKRDGAYVLICAEGGTKENHHQVAFRAPSLRGPYVAAPAPILSQQGLDPARPGRVVQAGHADLVETPAGDWWAVFLGSRPSGPNELDFSTGRETFLLPVSWRTGWPVILPPGAPVPLRAPRPDLPPDRAATPPLAGDYVFTENFRRPALDRRWSWLRSPAPGWWRAGGGVLRVRAGADPLGGTGQPAFLAVRQAHPDAAVEVTVTPTPGDRTTAAGLAVFQSEGRHYVVTIDRRGPVPELRLSRRTSDAEPLAGVAVARVTMPDGTRRVRMRAAIRGPELRFAYRPDGGAWRGIGGVQDARLLTTASAGGFSGVLMGVVAQAGR